MRKQTQQHVEYQEALGELHKNDSLENYPNLHEVVKRADAKPLDTKILSEIKSLREIAKKPTKKFKSREVIEKKRTLVPKKFWKLTADRRKTAVRVAKEITRQVKLCNCCGGWYATVTFPAKVKPVEDLSGQFEDANSAARHLRKLGCKVIMDD